MQWCDFYDAFWDWSDSTRKTRISSLEDIGSGDEVVEAVLEIEDEKVKAQLIRKAMRLGVKLTADDFANLDGELPADLYEQLGQYTGYDHKDPYFDEDNMEWDDFYSNFSDWSDEILLRRIKKLKKFGPSDEVSDAVQCMPSPEAEDLLYKKAVSAGVRFTDDEMLAMGNFADVIKNTLDSFEEAVVPQRPNATPVHNTETEQTSPRRSYMGLENTVVDIQILNVEDHGSNVLVNYTKVFGNGSIKTCRTHVKDLGGYYRFFSAKPIISAECIGKVYLGLIKSDVRILFIVKLSDGSAELIQTREGSDESLKLLQLSEDTTNGYVQPPSPTRTHVSSEPAKPYQLGKNELPQGSYLIGRDIPVGTYDFFVVYGSGGRFDIGKYDTNDKVIDGTWNFYWVGLKEDYEKRELIHIECKDGYTVKIGGNVILKIAKSQKVKIEL